MQSIEVHAHVGADGLLKLELATNLANTELEVLVVIQPHNSLEASENLGWPAGFFEQTYGMFRDNPLERLPQGEYEIREELP